MRTDLFFPADSLHVSVALDGWVVSFISSSIIWVLVPTKTLTGPRVFDHFRKAAFTPQVLRGLNPEGLASAEPLTKAEMCWDSVVPELLFLILFINFTVSDTNHNNVLSFSRAYRSAIAVIKTWTYKQESLFFRYANVTTSKSSTDPIFYWTSFFASEGYVFGQVSFVASSIFPKLVYQYKLHLEYFSVARGTVCVWLPVWEAFWNITTWIKTIWHMYPMIHSEVKRDDLALGRHDGAVFVGSAF